MRKVTLEYSDDGDHTRSNIRERSLGEQGEYRKRVQFWRMGAFRNRTFTISVSSPIKRDILGAVAYMEDSNG